MNKEGSKFFGCCSPSAAINGGLKIHLWPHIALRTVCAPVTAAEFGAELAATAQEMLSIIKHPATRGIGLAANQIGITKRFFVMTTAAGSGPKQGPWQSQRD